MLHVSRPIRWDSDHVVILNDDVQDLAVRSCVATPWTGYISFWIISTLPSIVSVLMSLVAVPRKKAFMLALLEPIALLRQYEDEGKYFQRLALQEEAKSLPWGCGLGYVLSAKWGPRRRVLYR